ncbi:MAG TPA: sialidase family protein [Terracidiphilus sp.]|nr:sialidase family protein [Terracidiphilus sp.]
MKTIRSTMALILVIAAMHSLAQNPAPNIDGFIFQPLESGKALPGTQRNSHASTLVELKDGDVMAAWFAGTREGAPDVAIYGARLHDGMWSTPTELARAASVPCWNPVLFHTRDGRLWLYYKYGPKPAVWAGARKWSTDEGRTWSNEERLPPGILGPIKDKPLLLPDGVIVSGSSVETPRWTAWVERSVDNGSTWTKFGPITVPDSADVPDDSTIAEIRSKLGSTGGHYPPRMITVGIIQPSVVWLGGHHLRFYARSQTRSALIAVADSQDDGKTWTQAHFIALPNPNSGIDAVRLKDGRVVLAFNNSFDKRTPLNLAVSVDGEHFRIFKTLEDSPGEYSYPALIEAKNGDLLVTYTWQRQTIKFVRVPLGSVPMN